jgi:tetratricopeptide (TPR) repeat protein
MKRAISFARGNAIPLAVILLATLGVFGPSLGHDFLLNWDDPPYVTKNEVIRKFTWTNLKTVFSSFYVGNYAPLQMVSYMVDHALWGMRPAGFIFGNIACHGTAGLLFYLLLRRFSLAAPAALAGTLLFLLHPVQVESVVWISQRKTVLAMVFYLLSFHGYLDWYRQRGGGSSYILSLAAFAAALLTKSVAVVLPLTLLLHDHCFGRERRQGKLFLDKIPYLLAALAVVVLALMSQSPEYNGGGRTGFHGGSLWATLLTMLPIYVTYLRMLVWPSGLSIVYAPPIRTTVDPVVIASLVVLLLLAGGVLWAYRRDRRLFFWLAAVPVGLLPVSQLVPLVTLMNDRYLYFPLLGVGASAAVLLDRALRTQPARRWLILAGCALVVVILAGISLQRSRVWQNSFLLWDDATTKQPTSGVAWLMYGELFEGKGKFGEAIACEERAVATCRGVECRLALRKLSELYLRESRGDDAQRSIAELLRRFPEAGDGYALRGHRYYQAGMLDKAESDYLEALKRAPGMVSALSALGNVYLATSRPELAMKQFETVRRLQKPNAELVYSMACAAALLGKRDRALEYLDEALRLGYNNPNLILNNPELNAIKGEAEFSRLMQRYFPGR